jgi:hypothetical protein
MQNWSPRHHVPSADAERSDDLAPSLRTLRSMDDYRFERFVADLRAEMGDRTTVRRASGDGGIDVLARKRGPGGATEAIQAKRYEESTTVGGSVTLAATAYIVARVAGVPQTRAVLRPEVVGVVGVAWSVAVSLGLLAIERRVIAAAADGW